jgi:homocysteine S-methyltransferase
MAIIMRGRAVESIGANSDSVQYIHGDCVSIFRYVQALLESALPQTTKALLAYANSGESYTAVVDAGGQDAAGWSGCGCGFESEAYAMYAEGWLRLAVQAKRGLLVGGCCRTTPEHIAAVEMRRRLVLAGS